MTKTNSELLAVAIKQLGNGGSIYRKYTGLSGNQPYCDAFVFWLFDANGCGGLLKWKGNARTSAPYSIKWCEKNLAQIPPYLGMACDIVYYDWEPNGRPNHVGICESKWGVNSIHAIEGNTKSGKKSGIVARKDRKGYIQAVFRPHFKPATLPEKKELTVDGAFGYKSIFMLQIVLGCTADAVLGKNIVKALQKKAGAKVDGAWGPGTSKAVQKMIGANVDGKWGRNSTKALQKWINKQAFPKTSTTTKPVQTEQPSVKAQKAVGWARSIAKGGKYTYKKFNNKNKKTKQCPICHKLTGKYKGWNCIGFCSAAYFHGAGMKVTCACNGIGTDGFYNKVTEASWKQRNGNDWKMISNGGSKGGADIPASKLLPGDNLICYDTKGKFHHTAIYTGNGKYIDCTNTSKKHIAERNYTTLTSKYQVTRAFRPL